MKAEFVDTYTIASQKETADVLIMFKQRTLNFITDKKTGKVKTEVADVDVMKMLIPKQVAKDLINSLIETFEKEGVER